MLHNSQKDFLKRHIGPSDEDQNKMLKELNYNSLDDLIKSTVPEKIQLKDGLNIGESNSEYEALRKLKAFARWIDVLFDQNPKGWWVHATTIDDVLNSIECD